MLSRRTSTNKIVILCTKFQGQLKIGAKCKTSQIRLPLTITEKLINKAPFREKSKRQHEPSTSKQLVPTYINVVVVLVLAKLHIYTKPRLYYI